MGTVHSLDFCYPLFSRENSNKNTFNEFYFVNTFCKDKNIKEVCEIAQQNGYTYEIIQYNKRYLVEGEVFFPKRINFYTYKYNEDVVEYATIG